MSSCTCNAGYFGDGITCVECKSCSTFATPSNICSPGSASDTSTCSCNAGYYGDGFQCKRCMACSSHAVSKDCEAGSVFDSSSCTCNSGYAGDGYTCTACRTCSAYAVSDSKCSFGSSSDIVSCSCNSGYYGDGFTCVPCHACHQYATLVNTCQHGSTADSVSCTCNNGYFGDGLKCVECKHCHSKAHQQGFCSSGSTTDTVVCKCNVGFEGDGVKCSMSASHNQDIFLERRKTYFYWARQLEKLLPNFQAAKDAYVAATSDATHWMFESGGQHQTLHKNSVIGGLEKSRAVMAMYKRLRVKRDERSAYHGPRHAASGESRGRNHQPFSRIPRKDSVSTNTQHNKHRSSVRANSTWNIDASVFEPIRSDAGI
uniref:EGF-like domain-containing protein n=1 Tax=Cryptomonas curvata TaxID=233186 RepID=A0A7S0N314_9CRYP